MGIWPVFFLLIVVISWKNESHSLSGAEVELKESQNVGTVLFDRTSLIDHCWTNEEFITLSSRKMFQDLLPRIDYLNIHSDDYVAGLLNYFAVCLQKIGSSTDAKIGHLMLRAITDVMGGYLYTYVAPIVKVSFYTGKVRYCNVKKIYMLLDQIKTFLHTDGLGWKKPPPLEMFINVTPIVVQPEASTDACEKLILRYPMAPVKNENYRDRRDDSRENTGRKFVTDDTIKDPPDYSMIFMPYFDNNTNPNSIALPFKDHTLLSLYDETSVGVLTRFYETSVDCISSMDEKKKILKKFNTEFYTWLIRSVYPHLGDDKWYPAFGGVLRIIIFLKKKVKIRNDPTNVKSVLDIGLDSDENNMSTVQLIIVAVVTAICVWLIAALLLICYGYFRHSRGHVECTSDSPEVDLYDTDLEGICSRALLCSNSDICSWSRSIESYNPLASASNEHKSNSVSRFCYPRQTGGAHSSQLSTLKELPENHHKGYNTKRKKNVKSNSSSRSCSSSSPQTHYINNRFHYSTGLSSSSSDDYDR